MEFILASNREHLCELVNHTPQSVEIRLPQKAYVVSLGKKPIHTALEFKKKKSLKLINAVQDVLKLSNATKV